MYAVQKETYMKHHTLVTKSPQVAQSNFEAKTEFKVNLTDQVIEAAFLKTS